MKRRMHELTIPACDHPGCDQPADYWTWRQGAGISDDRDHYCHWHVDYYGEVPT